jgi:hypothetical protein
MPTFVRRLLERLSQRVDRAAAGSPVPAGLEPPVPGEPPKPTAHERTLMRRRLRALRRSREALLLDADGADVEQLDAEARALAEALDQRKTLDQVIASGIVKRCSSCGELMAPREGECAACGQGVKPDRGPRTADRETSKLPPPPTRVPATPAARGSGAD